jgi:5-methylcytosine-specific restriction endonuclease McrA
MTTAEFRRANAIEDEHGVVTSPPDAIMGVRKVPPHRVNGRGLTPEVSPMPTDDTTRREKQRVYRRAWYVRNREWALAYAASYRTEHLEECRASDAAYDAAHREERQSAARLYRATHRDERAALQRGRRARLRGSPGRHTVADVAAQRTRQKGRCYWCGVKVGRHYQVDHVMPTALGGSNGPENLVISCVACNLAKNAKHPMDWAGRLL